MKRALIAGAVLIVCALAVVAWQASRQEPPATRLRGADLLQLAPADTTFAVVVNYRKLRESGVLERVGQLRDISAVGGQRLQTTALFVSGDPLPQYVLSAVATHKPEDAPQVLASLEENSQGGASVDGRKAYVIGDGVIALPDGRGTVLFGSSGEALGDVMRACRAGKGDPPAHLLGSARPFAARQLCFVLLVRPYMKNTINPQLPTWCADIVRVAGGVDFTETDFTLDATAAFADSDAARRAREEFGSSVSRAGKASRQELERMENAGTEGEQVEILRQMLAVIDGVQVSGEDTELRLRMHMNLEALQKADAILMAMLAVFPMGEPPQ